VLKIEKICVTKLLHKKNDFAEGSTILLDTDLKIILLNQNNCVPSNMFHQNNLVGTLKIMSNVAKNFHIPATSLNVLHNYFDKIIFLICIQLKF